MFNIVARKFTTGAEFADYLKTVGKQDWVKRIVLHNTAAPTIAQRPGGILTEQHILNLQSYYASPPLNWSGGPHLFIDAGGIWVFNPLDDPGVHSPSYNKNSWGVEMLGNYDIESFISGLGAEIASHTFDALYALMTLQGWPLLTNKNFLLHKEDPKTTHVCPGKNVVKSSVMAMVNQLGAADNRLVIAVDGVEIPGGFVKDGVTYAPVRKLGEALGYAVNYDAKKNRVDLVLKKTDN